MRLVTLFLLATTAVPASAEELKVRCGGRADHAARRDPDGRLLFGARREGSP